MPKKHKKRKKSKKHRGEGFYAPRREYRGDDDDHGYRRRRGGGGWYGMRDNYEEMMEFMDYRNSLRVPLWWYVPMLVHLWFALQTFHQVRVHVYAPVRMFYVLAHLVCFLLYWRRMYKRPRTLTLPASMLTILLTVAI